MHEMSIAEGIVDIALDTLTANDGHVVHSIQLELGLMSGVERDALLFCFDSVTKGTAAEGAKLEIKTIPIKVQCLDCDAVFMSDTYRFACDKCGSRLVNVLEGREMRVVSIDMD